MRDDKVQRIIELEENADKLESEASDVRWEAARLISEELASGTSQRALASAIGKSQPHVFRMKTVWERFARESVRPPFSEAMNSVAPRGEPKAKTEPKDKVADKPEPRARPRARPKPEPVTDKKAIAERLTNGTLIDLYDWLMDQGEARLTETDDAIRLVVHTL